MKLIIKEYLQTIDKTVYWLMKETGLSKKSTYDLVNNKTNGITFDTLYKICKALKCTPNDIIDMK